MGFDLEVIWFDDDVVEVRVAAGNGLFSGSTDCYDGLDVFARLAQVIRGFPSSRDDSREFEIGTFNKELAGGGARIQVRVVDGAGHVDATVDLRTHATRRGRDDECAHLHFSVEPAAIDEFVAALEDMEVAIGCSASLREAT